MTQTSDHPEPVRPHRAIAERVKDIRKRRGWTAARLAEEMAGAGIRWDRSIVANLENGRRAAVSVEELLALAYVLNVAPVHLMVPLEGDGWYAVAPDDYSTRNDRARAWIRGDYALAGHTDERLYFSEVPQSEWSPPRRLSEAEQDEAEHELAAAGIATRVRVTGSGDVEHYDPASRSWVNREGGS